MAIIRRITVLWVWVTSILEIPMWFSRLLAVHVKNKAEARREPPACRFEYGQTNLRCFVAEPLRDGICSLSQQSCFKKLGHIGIMEKKMETTMIK